MVQDNTEIPQALRDRYKNNAIDVINPMENVMVQPPKGRFSDSDRMAANNAFSTEEKRNESMEMGSQIINNKMT